MIANQPVPFNIQAPVKGIYKFLRLVVILNIFFLAGTWFFAEKELLPGNITFQWWLSELNLAKENVAAAWYSSMLFFLTGIAALLCFWADMQRNSTGKMRLLNYGWIGMAGVFVMLSFDEMGSFHEMISQTSLFKHAGGGNGKIIFFGLIGAVAIFMGAFFISKFKTDKLALILTITGLLLFLSNPFQEKFEIESWRNSADPANWRRPVIYLLIEEGSEIFASFCFLFSFIIYAVNAAPGTGEKNEKVLQLNATANKHILYWLGSLVALLGISMWVINKNAWEIPGDDDGLPQDWPPAATAFASFAAAIYLYFKKAFSQNKTTYLLVAITALFTSAYFGSYMYGYGEGPFSKMRFVLLGISLLSGLVLVTRLKGTKARFLFVAWIAFMLLSFIKRDFISAAAGYAGTSCLFTGLWLHYHKETRNSGVTTT